MGQTRPYPLSYRVSANILPNLSISTVLLWDTFNPTLFHANSPSLSFKVKPSKGFVGLVHVGSSVGTVYAHYGVFNSTIGGNLGYLSSADWIRKDQANV